MRTFALKGKVFTGEGSGKKYLSLPWVKQQIEEKLGYTPFVGTLNLRLNEESVEQQKQLKTLKAMIISPKVGYCVGMLLKAHVYGVDCAVVLPQVEGYPNDVLEIIASVNLRERLKLKDEDTIVVTIEA